MKLHYIKSGSLPQWDDLSRQRLRNDSQGNQTNNPFASHRLGPFSVESGIARQKKLGALGSPQDHMILMAEVLKDYQGFHIVDSMNHPWKVCFPFAIFLKKGDKIFNLTTNDQYTVQEIVDEEEQIVRLTGTTPPTATNRLRLSDENTIVLTHGWPRSFVSSHKISTTDAIADQPSAYNEAIEWVVTRSQPTTDKNVPPFSTRGLKPRGRESTVHPLNPFEVLEVESLEYDNIFAFDVWARNNMRAELLLTWFEDFMDRTSWILELYGGCKIFYWSRNEDEEVYHWRSDLTKRTVKFHYRTQKLRWLSLSRINKVDVRIQMGEEEAVTQNDILLWPEPSDASSVVVTEI